ncbi:NACHT domain-containing protein [Streptomyces rhizosphaericus]|uniref:NACHT domain-containing protein n=1 Tax=Streptomyces rhizosphaericus TaxID=114699 RepID=A0A6G4AIS0_9ACTN|nr:NACHT domain-containing protein [Streptomyces rhizosphaericus]NEW72531.1 NACHT domain-containing protein [Streptomyces rhizosphaericus]
MVGTLSTVAVGVWVVLQFRQGQDAVDVASLAGLVVAVAGLAVAVAGLRLARAALGRPGDSAAQAVSAAATLARQVERAESEEWRRLIGGDHCRINLRYTLHSRPPPDARAPGPHGQLYDDGRGASVPDIVAYYRATVPARLVVTGAPGAGKTVLALELLLGLIEDRGAHDPVPVRVPLVTWDTDVPFEKFLIDHLVQNLDWPRDRAAQLVEHGLVLPVLDGLDEMDPGLVDTAGRPVLDAEGRPEPDPCSPRARAALAALNAYGRGRTAGALILTCRTTHYEALLYEEQLRDAARISISPVLSEEALRYFADRSGHTPRWQALLEYLRTDSGSALAQSLTTPWRLSLAATVYSRAGDPSELQTLATPQDVDDYLLARLIPAALTLHPPKRRYTPDDTRRWLSGIARSLQRPDRAGDTPAQEPFAESDTEIHLHRFWRMTEERVAVRDFQILVALPLFLASVCSLAFGLQLPGIPLSVWWAFCGLMAWANEATPHRFNWQGPAAGESRRDVVAILQGGVIASVGSGTVTGLICGYFLGLKAALTAGLVVGLIVVLLGPLAVQDELQGPPTTVSRPAAVLRADLLYRIGAGWVYALIAGLAFGLLFGAFDGFAAGLFYGALFGMPVVVMSAASSALWRYFVFLSLRPALPFRLNAFLAWSYDAGLLRMSGNAYQFRHREFQRWLTTHPLPEA